MADRIFISELAQAESVNGDLMFVGDDGTQTNKVKASQIADYIKDNLGDVGSVKSVNEVLPDENGNITLTAEDIGITPGTGGGGSENIKSFSSYTQLGLTVDDFVADDFMANAIKIFEAMPDYSELMMRTFNSNLSKSIATQINNDIGGTLANTVGSTLFVEKTTQDFSGNFRVILNSRSLSYEYFCMLHYNSTDGYLITKFANTYRPDGFLPLTAGSIYALKDSLYINRSTYPALRLVEKTNNSGFVMNNYSHAGTLEIQNVAGASENRRVLMLRDSAYSSSSLETSFILRDYISSKYTTYNLFGEHNKPIGTYEGSGSTASRTINVGGIGNVLVITSSYGMAWVTTAGAITKTASSTSLGSLNASAVKFVDGVLTMASNSAFVNSSSYDYSYQLL